MELASVERLIQKYLDAETTLQEEKELRAYFVNTKNVAPHLEEYRSLFVYFNNEQNDNYNKPITITKKSNTFFKLSIAAAVAVLISAYMLNVRSKKITNKQEKETEIAMIETQKAFQLISENLKKGESIAVAGLSEYDKTKRKVFNNY